MWKKDGDIPSSIHGNEFSAPQVGSKTWEEAASRVGAAFFY